MVEWLFTEEKMFLHMDFHAWMVLQMLLNHWNNPKVLIWFASKRQSNKQLKHFLHGYKNS